MRDMSNLPPGVSPMNEHINPSNAEMTNQDIINALEQRLRTLRQRPCPGIDFMVKEGLLHGHPSDCLCSGTGTITDPRYQAAWGLLVYPPIVTSTQVFGRVTRLVGDWPDGAVRGLLEEVVGALPEEVAEWLLEHRRGDAWWSHGRFRWPGSSLQEFGKALLEALND